MSKIARSILAVGVAVLLLAPASMTASASGTATLVVKITTTNVTWGTVHVKWIAGGKTHKAKACSSASCTYHPPRHAKVRLTESAHSSATWPFKKWKLNNAGHMSGTASPNLSFQLKGANATAQAVYVLHL